MEWPLPLPAYPAWQSLRPCPSRMGEMYLQNGRRLQPGADLATLPGSATAAAEPEETRETQGMTIHPVIMCGGSGTRLWPVSDQACPKQFHRLVSEKSVFQETVLRLRAEGFAAPVVISNAAHRGLIEAQLAEIGAETPAMFLEPEGRNTAAAAALAALHLAAAGEDTLGLLVPSDHYIGRPEVFRGAVRAAADAARKGYITAFGIAPARPDTGFGYIQAGACISGAVSAVAAFREKPDPATAASYVAGGAYSCNAGIFLFRPDTLLAEFEAHAPDILRTRAQPLRAPALTATRSIPTARPSPPSAPPRLTMPLWRKPPAPPFMPRSTAPGAI